MPEARPDKTGKSNLRGPVRAAEEAARAATEPVANIEGRVYRILLRSLGYLSKVEIWTHGANAGYKGDELDRIKLAHLAKKSPKLAIELLEIRKTCCITLARLLLNKGPVAMPPEVPASGADKIGEMIKALDELKTFEEVDAEITKLRREETISRTDAGTLRDDARERFGLETETEEEHSPEAEMDDLMDEAVLKAAAGKPDEESEEEDGE